VRVVRDGSGVRAGAGKRRRRARLGVRLRLPEALRGRAPAYGVLAAVGAAALIVLVLGLVTVGVLGGGSSTAASTGESAEARKADTSVVPARPPSSNDGTPNASGDPPLPTATSVSTAPGTDWPTPWLEVMRALDVQRSTAFKKVDDTALDAVYVPGSVPWKADKKLLATYRNQHLRIEGLAMEIRSLVIESEETNHAVLQIVDRLVSGTAVDAAGRRTTFPPGKPTSRRITLEARTPGTWRIAEITRV
jgi:hypothetical protein